jgi:HAD superfamily hydrolase (TIGR01549 family)
MKIQAVIFDFDGVILDSCTGGMEKIIKIVEANGFTIPPNIRTVLKDNWGRPGAKMIEKSFGLNSRTSQEIYRQWEVVDAVFVFPLVKGVKDVLSTLKFGKNLELGLLTSRNRMSLFRVLERYSLIMFFDNRIQCQDDFPHVKPNPRTFDFILKLLSASEGECVFVGDTPTDFAATYGRKIDNVSVLTGIHNKNDLLKAGQKRENIICSIADLPEWIEKYRT